MRTKLVGRVKVLIPENSEEEFLVSQTDDMTPPWMDNELKKPEIIKKEMATPPRPGLVFDRNRHRWIRPIAEVPKETDSDRIITDFGVEGDQYEVLKEWLVNIAETDVRMSSSQVLNHLLRVWSDKNIDGPKVVGQFIDVAIQNALRNGSTRDILRATETSLAVILEGLPFDSRIEKSLERLLANRDRFTLPDAAPDYMRLTYSSELYSGPEGFRRKYSNLLLQGAKNVYDLHSAFRASYSSFYFASHDALVDKIIEALKSWNLNTNGEYRALADDFFVLLSDVKPSRLEEYTTEGLRLFDKWKAKIPGSDSIANYGREEIQATANRSLKAIKQIGLPAIKHYAETRELKLDFNNEFRKMLEDIPRDDTLDPGVQTKKVVSILMQEIGLKDIHEQLRDDWETGCTTPGALLIAETAGELYDGERKHYNDEKEDGPTYTEYPPEKLKEYVKAHYELTQQMLRYSFKDRETLTLYRGTTVREALETEDDLENNLIHGRLKSGDQIQVDPNSTSSWSLSKKVAYKFAHKKGERGVVLRSEVPLSSIYGYCASYCYKGNEREFIVINDPKNKYYYVDSNVPRVPGDDN